MGLTTIKSRQLSIMVKWFRRCRLSECFGVSSFVGGFIRLHVVPPFPRETTLSPGGKEKAETSTAARDGASRSIAIHGGAGADGSAEGRWRFVSLCFVV